jgi:hypothetical protein
MGLRSGKDEKPGINVAAALTVQRGRADNLEAGAKALDARLATLEARFESAIHVLRVRGGVDCEPPEIAKYEINDARVVGNV